MEIERRQRFRSKISKR